MTKNAFNKAMTANGFKLAAQENFVDIGEGIWVDCAGLDLEAKLARCILVKKNMGPCTAVICSNRWFDPNIKKKKKSRKKSS